MHMVKNYIDALSFYNVILVVLYLSCLCGAKCRNPIL